MSGGLKQQWGVGEAAQAGSDAQSQELKTAFEKAMNAMAEHLQYTAANPAPPLEKGKASWSFSAPSMFPGPRAASPWTSPQWQEN